MDNPYRRSLRHASADYTGEQGYFITICAANRRCLFGAIAGGEMTLSALGRIAEEELRAVTVHRPYVFIDAYVIMPDHIHAILFINHGNVPASPSATVDPQLAAALYNPIASAPKPVSGPYPVLSMSSGRSGAVGPQQAAGLQGVTPQSLSAIVRGYKAAVTKRANELALGPGGPIWQPNYHDHIIRNEHDLNLIRAYIDANPARWAEESDESLNPPVWNRTP